MKNPSSNTSNSLLEWLANTRNEHVFSSFSWQRNHSSLLTNDSSIYQIYALSDNFDGWIMWMNLFPLSRFRCRVKSSVSVSGTCPKSPVSGHFHHKYHTFDGGRGRVRNGETWFSFLTSRIDKGSAPLLRQGGGHCIGSICRLLIVMSFKLRKIITLIEGVAGY